MIKYNELPGELSDVSVKKKTMGMVPAVGSDAGVEVVLAVTSVLGVATAPDVATECARSLAMAARSWAL